MNLKILLVFALVALAVAEAQKKGNGKNSKGGKDPKVCPFSKLRFYDQHDYPRHRGVISSCSALFYK